MEKVSHKINVIKQIENTVDIVGNHPNQNPDRVFLYINYDIQSFEDSFDEIFSIPELESEDFCLISSNCEITLPNGEKFCGISFKSNSNKELILQKIKKHFEKKGYQYGVIRNNNLILSTKNVINLDDCSAFLYDYD